MLNMYFFTLNRIKKIKMNEYMSYIKKESILTHFDVYLYICLIELNVDRP